MASADARRRLAEGRPHGDRGHAATSSKRRHHAQHRAAAQKRHRRRQAAHARGIPVSYTASAILHNNFNQQDDGNGGSGSSGGVRRQPSKSSRGSADESYEDSGGSISDSKIEESAASSWSSKGSSTKTSSSSGSEASQQQQQQRSRGAGGGGYGGDSSSNDASSRCERRRFRTLHFGDTDVTFQARVAILVHTGLEFMLKHSWAPIGLDGVEAHGNSVGLDETVAVVVEWRLSWDNKAMTAQRLYQARRTDTSLGWIRCLATSSEKCPFKHRAKSAGSATHKVNQCKELAEACRSVAAAIAARS